MSFDGTSGSIELDIEAKIFECDEAISQNPQDANALRQRGLLRARLGRYDEAMQDLDWTLKLAPEDAHAYGLRALVWTRKGDREGALRDFDEAIRLAPQNAELYRSHRGFLDPGSDLLQGHASLGGWK
jgi:tetratricopeptide (TPR) repeat protein